MINKINRRTFLQNSALTGLAAGLGSMSMAQSTAEPLINAVPSLKVHKPLDKVRVGFIGLGGMGGSHMRNLMRIQGVEIKALCDIVGSKVKRWQKEFEKSGKQQPEGYSRGEHDFKRMCQRDDIDLVYAATPWRWHAPMCIEAMKAGKHAAVEVPAFMTIEECWNVVKTAESTGQYCVMLENCNYDRFEMIVLNMVKKGVLGELLHGQCGYLHDLRGVKFRAGGEGLWRREWSKTHNADLYPTHGLGPVSQCMDINRGNRFDYLVSMSTKSRGLHCYAVNRFGADSPQAKEKYMLGDVVTTQIRTVNGETIILTHDTNGPRSYSRDFYIQGTKGVARKYPEPGFFIEGKSKGHRTWDDLDKFKDEYQHPLWRKMEELAAAKSGEGVKGGHGGMDCVEDYRLINALRKGIEPDMDVYDAVALSSIVDLSGQSISQGSKPIKIPDFTQGMWKKARQLQVMNESTY